MAQLNRKQSLAFLLGTFISSLGSTTFRVSLMAFMKMSGYSLADIGLAMGGMRVSSLVASMFLGDIADKVSVRKVIFWTEVLGALSAGVLAWTWAQGPSYFIPFLLICLFRASVMAIQEPARAKVAKLMSENTHASNSKQAIWLNKVTHGTIFFAAGISLLATQYANFYSILIFDACTFLAGAILILRATEAATPATAVPKLKLFQKFRDLYRYNPEAATLDLMLAFAMTGTNLIIVRFAGDNEAWIPLYLASYGFAVWATGYLHRLPRIREQHVSLWVGLAASYLLLGFVGQAGWLTFFCFGLIYHFYWLIFHRYSTHFQIDSPKEVIAGVNAARVTQMVLVLAAGELLVGAWQSFISLFWEGAWRAVFGLAVAAALVAYKLAKGEQAHATETP